MKYFLYIVILISISCKKPFSALYNTMESVQVSLLTDTCVLTSISSNNFQKIEEEAIISYVTLRQGYANRLINNNYLLNKNKIISRVFINDTLSIVDGDSVFLYKNTKYVDRIITKKKPLDLDFDQYEYKFIYKDSLLDTRLMFVNGDTIPYYESKYTYTKTNLTKLEMKFKPDNILIFETNFIYDKDFQVKPWLYFYSDFFNMSDYLLMFNFGTMPTGIITSMKSAAYDLDGIKILGQWEVKFSNYKISKDKYVMRFSSFGDRLQSLPFLFQNAELKYQCIN